MKYNYEFIIKPPKHFLRIDWRELWRYRDLFIVFSWREISVRYKQTVLGIMWALFQPLITMIVFTFIFNRMAKIESGDNTPYPIFLYVGLLIWQYYSGTLTKASESMVSNANIIQKVYFPRLIIPASTAITGLVDMVIAATILGVMMLFYGYYPHLLGLLILPLILFCTVLCTMGIGLFFASLNIKYRDVRYALPFFIQIFMYVTPVIYPIRMLDNHPFIKALMLWMNPISGLIDTARASLLGNSPIDWGVFGISFIMSSLLFVFGLFYFRNTERYFADIV